jgi:hypothetical protein
MRDRRSPLISVFVLAAGVAMASGCSSESFTGAPVTTTPPEGDDCACCGSNGAGVDAGCGDAAAPTPHPNFGPLVTASDPPPPISGGTLLVTHDGKMAVAADTDRDVVHVVGIAAQTLTFDVALQHGDEPGRVVEDGAGRVHVALRGGGAVATIDPAKGALLARRAVCPAPRGLAWDQATDLVHVACATGELVSMPAAGGAPTRTVVIERDLRDVVDEGGVLTVTKFRSAEVLRLAADGTVADRRQLGVDPSQPGFVPHVAWRAVPTSAGGILVVHQAETTKSVDVQVPHGYGGGGPSIVETVVTQLDANGSQVGQSVAVAGLVLPVDVAMSSDGKVAIASPGNAFFLDGATMTVSEPGWPSNTVQGVPGPPKGQAVAVAFVDDDHLIVQSREPAQLWFVDVTDPFASQGTTISLSKVTRDDSGHDIFHVMAGVEVACASCHPEGGDDGHVWTLSGNARRTPSLRGTIAGTAPYHWPGDLVAFPALVDEVYTRRMSGTQLDGPQTAALQHWVEAIPAPSTPSWVDPASAGRGQAIFGGAQVACARCHSGPKLTNNATVDVGTGGAFQVPPLVGVGWRTPLLHDGCAATIAERFGTCATPAHGDVSKLSPQDLIDLGNYLETL